MNKDKKLNGVWRCMRYRCNSKSPNNHYAPYYRNKGIRVCKEWEESFNAFREWALANGYREGLTIDRLDPDGNYEPGNCHWISRAENSRRAGKSSVGRSVGGGRFSVIYQYPGDIRMRFIAENLLYRDAKALVEKLQREDQYSRWSYNIYPRHGNFYRHNKSQHGVYIP